MQLHARVRRRGNDGQVVGSRQCGGGAGGGGSCTEPASATRTSTRSQRSGCGPLNLERLCGASAAAAPKRDSSGCCSCQKGLGAGLNRTVIDSEHVEPGLRPPGDGGAPAAQLASMLPHPVAPRQAPFPCATALPSFAMQHIYRQYSRARRVTRRQLNQFAWPGKDALLKHSLSVGGQHSLHYWEITVHTLG